MDKRTICLIIINILLLLMLLAAKRKKRLHNFVLLLTTVVLTLSITEFVYRLFIKQHHYFVGDLGSDFFKEDSLLGYTIKKTGTLQAVKMDGDDTVFVKSYTVIADSTQPSMDFNHRVGFQNTDTARETIFLGCSITFGVGLEDTACLAHRTGRLTMLNSRNLGVQGYGTHQVYQLFLNKYAAVSNANRVFVYSFIHDHILRANGVYDWNLGGPHYSIRSDSLIHEGSLSTNVGERHQRYIHYLSGLGSFSFLRVMLSNIATRRRINNMQQADFDRCFLMIRNMADRIKSTGGQFILLDWGGNQWNHHMINKALLAEFRKKLQGIAGLRIVQASSLMDLNDPRHFIPNDGHPSALANEKLAAGLSSMKCW